MVLLVPRFYWCYGSHGCYWSPRYWGDDGATGATGETGLQVKQDNLVLLELMVQLVLDLVVVLMTQFQVKLSSLLMMV